MSIRNWAPVVYGSAFGALVGGIGAAQVVASVYMFAAQSAALDKLYPPDYTGYRDGTNLVRGAEENFVFTGFVALVGIAAILTIAAMLSASATRKFWMGIVTTFVAGTICTFIYIVANALTFPTGFNPLALFDTSFDGQNYTAVFAIIGFQLAWTTGLLGSTIGTLSREEPAYYLCNYDKQV
ncbi:MAG TPA: hypothetical protein VFW17_01315 [Ktedonobacterales bacterium]|nr:hypothetical protein [Ktedonobacterales bacterium]